MEQGVYKLMEMFQNIFISPNSQRQTNNTTLLQPVTNKNDSSEDNNNKPVVSAVIEVSTSKHTTEGNYGKGKKKVAIDKLSEDPSGVDNLSGQLQWLSISEPSTTGELVKEDWKPATNELAGVLLRDRMRDIIEFHVQYYRKNAWRFRQASGVLTDFHPFSRLPPELRIKIWEMSNRQPRIIAVDFATRRDRAGTPKRLRFEPDRRHDEGEFYNPRLQQTFDPRVCAESRTPSVLRVNRESRAEGLKIYERRIFDKASGRRPFYFNPEIDFIYYGGQIQHFRAMDQIIDAKPGFPRLLIDLNKTFVSASGFSAAHIIANLHGKFEDEDADPLQREIFARSLKQVLFIISPGSSDTDLNKVDGSVYLCPTMTDGLNEEQLFYKSQLEVEMKKIIEEKPFGENTKTASIGDDKPEFGFASLAALPRDDKVSESLRILATQFEQLERVRHSLRALEEATGCTLALCEVVRLNKGSVLTINIEGSKRGVKQCRQAIDEVLYEISHVNDWF